MWKNIEQFLNSDTTLEYSPSSETASESLKISVLALLLKGGLADKNLSSKELERAVSFIAREFDDSPDNIGTLVETAEFLSKDPTKLNTLIGHIAKDLSKGQKQEVLKGVWSVLKADGFVDQSESTSAVELRNLLGLSLEEAMFAQASSEDELNAMKESEKLDKDSEE